VAEAADSDRQQAALVVAVGSGQAATVDDQAVMADSGLAATVDGRAVMADSGQVATAVDPAVVADSGQVATAVDRAVMAGSDRVATMVPGPEATTALGQAAITALGPVVTTASGLVAITALGPVAITASDPVVTTVLGPVGTTASGPVAIIIDLMAIERTTRSTTTGFLAKSIFHASATTILLSTTGETSSRFQMPTFRTVGRLYAGISMATTTGAAGTATTSILGGVERGSVRVCGSVLLGAVSYHSAVSARFPCTTTMEHLLSTLTTA